MPKKKKDTRTEAEKEKARMVAKRRLMAYQKSLREPSKKKPVKRIKSQSRFSEIIANLRKKVGKLMGWETEKTKDVKRQLKRAGVKVKTDEERRRKR